MSDINRSFSAKTRLMGLTQRYVAWWKGSLSLSVSIHTSSVLQTWVKFKASIVTFFSIMFVDNLNKAVTFYKTITCCM